MNSDRTQFESRFEDLTRNLPFPWQWEIFQRFVKGNFPASCNLPTGLGKTSVIPIWLIALARNPENVPRRLVYVVNRRTVVDQATDEAKKMRERLPATPGLARQLSELCAEPNRSPLAISTLRGQFADNGEWRSDPARPAVIIGTVDMIGSRLLFSGYGVGFKLKPLHAGFLGQDVLLVHDEAHLEPAFQKLLEEIRREQDRCKEFRRFRVMALTATSRADGQPSDAEPPFELTKGEMEGRVPMVRERLFAKKGIAFPFQDVKTEKSAVAAAIIGLASKHESSGQAILVFVRTIEDVMAAQKELIGKKGVWPEQVELLTGTIRGLERDKMAKESRVFARFLPKPEATPQSGTVYLICTSAGEVGVDISADHLVCDLTPLDSMAQRFGRVNRRGAGAAKIDVVHESRSDERRSESAYDDARWATLKALRKLPPCDWITDRCDGSPKALGELIEGLSVRNRQAAFTPQPTILPTSDILFDAWALTTIREPLPGRPPVSDWLHGLAGWEPPDTYLAWREEVDVLKDLALTQEQLEDLLGDYPLKPHELLRDRTDRVFEQLTTCHERLQTRNLEPLVWIIDPFGTISRRPLSQLIARDKQKKPLVNLNGCTVLLPSSAGGLSKGMLNGDVHYTANHPGGEHVGYDVADKWFDEQGRPRRQRVWDDAGTPEGMRLVRIIDTDPNPDRGDSGEDERPARRFWKWYVRPRSADDEGSQSAFEPQALDEHHQRARMAAQRIAAALQLEEPEATALAFAAAWHDKGKNRSVWQQSIRNRDYPKQVLAKSGNNKLPLDLNHYRHEFGSLLDVHDPSETSELVGQPENVRDLVLHLIAAHHGRARPHFPEPEAFDPERPESVGRELANEVPQRFARLQRRYGRWGLAWLESLVRAADVIASQPESESAP